MIGYQKELFSVNTHIPNSIFAGDLTLDDGFPTVDISALGGTLSMYSQSTDAGIRGVITAGKASGPFAATGLQLKPVKFTSTPKVERLIPAPCPCTQ